MFYSNWSSFTRVVAGGLAFVVLIVGYQSLTSQFVAPVPEPEPDIKCVGKPIHAAYPYGGTMMGPHECAPQCDDHIRRYIVYSDGQATQCEPLPGCSDWGEDSGVTCLP